MVSFPIQINGEDLFEITSALREYYKDYFVASPKSEDPSLNPEKLASMVMNSKDPKSLPGKILEVYTKYNQENKVISKGKSFTVTKVVNSAYTILNLSESDLSVLSEAIKKFIKTANTHTRNLLLHFLEYAHYLYNEEKKGIRVKIFGKHGQKIMGHLCNLHLDMDDGNGDVVIQIRHHKDFSVLQQISLTEIQDIEVNEKEASLLYLLAIYERQHSPNKDQKTNNVRILYQDKDCGSFIDDDIAVITAFPDIDAIEYLDSIGNLIQINRSQVKHIWIDKKEVSFIDFLKAKAHQMLSFPELI